MIRSRNSFGRTLQEFRQYEAIDRRFPSSEHDVLAVIEGEALLTQQGSSQPLQMRRLIYNWHRWRRRSGFDACRHAASRTQTGYAAPDRT